MRLNFRFMGYVLRQYLWTVKWGKSYTTTLPLEVFTQRNFVADFIRLKLNFILKKKQKSLSEPPFGGLRGNVRTPSTARWKARGRLPIRHDWTSFAISYGWDVKVEICRSRSFSNRWVNLSANFRQKGAVSTNHCWYQNTRVIALSCCIKISAVLHLNLSQSTSVTDGQTDGWTALVYARAVKTKTQMYSFLH